MREREREEPARLWLWIEAGPAMNFASAPRLPTKLARARTFALALAIAAHAAGETVAAGGRAAPPHALRLDEPGPPALAAARPGDVACLAGAFLTLDLAATTATLAARGVGGVALTLADPAERDFPFTGATRFEPAPGVPPRDLPRAEATRDTYLAAWAAHRARLDTAAAPGWTVLHHATDEPPAPLLAAIAAWLRG